jgi:hypothetical protein
MRIAWSATRAIRPQFQQRHVPAPPGRSAVDPAARARPTRQSATPSATTSYLRVDCSRPRRLPIRARLPAGCVGDVESVGLCGDIGPRAQAKKNRPVVEWRRVLRRPDAELQQAVSQPVNAPLTAPTYPALAKPAPPSGEFLHQPPDVIDRAISAAAIHPGAAPLCREAPPIFVPITSCGALRKSGGPQWPVGWRRS